MHDDLLMTLKPFIEQVSVCPNCMACKSLAEVFLQAYHEWNEGGDGPDPEPAPSAE